MEQRNRAEDAEENKRKQAQFVDMICHEIRYPSLLFLFFPFLNFNISFTLVSLFLIIEPLSFIILNFKDAC